MYQITVRVIKTLDVQELDTEELGLYVAQLASVEAGYKASGQEVPAWFANAQKEGQTILALRQRDEKQRKLANLKARQSSLKTREEKRADVDAEIEALEKELA